MCEYQGDLIVGGTFFVPARGIARWDGKSWSSVDAAFEETQPYVTALREFQGDLIVGSRSQDVPYPYTVRRWNGSSTEVLGGSFDGYTNAFAIFEEELIAGGDFSRIDEKTIAPGVARWDGDAWQPIGSGLHRERLDGKVFALCVHQDALYAGGRFSHSGDRSVESVARWDGAEWQPVGEATPGFVVKAMLSDGGDLYVAGDFENADDPLSPCLSRWDGSSWHPLCPGLTSNSPLPPRARALTRYRGDLITAGYFTNASDVAASHIVRFDGSTWHSLAEGLSNPDHPQGHASAHVLLEWRGELFVGGTFTMAGTVSSRYVAHWGLDTR